MMQLVAMPLFLVIDLETAQGKSNFPPTDPAEFKTHVAPFFNMHCIRCHGPKKQRAKFTLHDIDGRITSGKDIVRWEKVLEMLSLNEMPPRKERQPTKAKRRQIVAWITKELRKIGRGPEENTASLPGHGNRVDHEALFSGEHKGPVYSKARVWRINRYIYNQFVGDTVGLKKIASPLKNADGTEFKDFSILTADEATIRTLLQNSKEIAKTLVHGRIIVDRKKNKKKHKKSRHRLLTEFAQNKNQPTATAMEEVVRYAFKLLLQRQPAADEVKRYAEQFLRKNIEVGGNDLAVQSLLIVLMMSPEFLFRMEMGLGEETEDGRRMLSPRELVYAISFAINDHPDRALLKAASTGRLKTRKDVEREVRRLLTSDDKRFRKKPKAGRYHIWKWDKAGNVAKPKLLRFFREFFGYSKALEIFKDDVRHSGLHRPAETIKEADLLILNVLKKDRDVFAQLLTTDEYFVAYQRTRKRKPGGYASVYNLDKKDWEQHQIVKMPKNERAGILTHPAWLAAFSTNFENDPVRRGKWIRERLLAEVIPDIPIGVAAQLPDAPQQTLRQRFHVVRKEECWRCHKKMNPLGEAFEMYDDFGRYRKQHFIAEDKSVFASFFEIRGYNRKKKKKTSTVTTRPVDSGGVLDGTRDPNLDGKVTGAIDLVHRLAKSTRVRQSFIRHAFRFWMGRNETLNDSPTLMAMDRAYCQSDGSFKEMLVALLTSDSFLYRK